MFLTQYPLYGLGFSLPGHPRSRVVAADRVLDPDGREVGRPGALPVGGLGCRTGRNDDLSVQDLALRVRAVFALQTVEDFLLSSAHFG